MENQSGEWTRLLYCTTGVLLRKLQHDRHLSSLTHIIVDEVLTAPDQTQEMSSHPVMMMMIIIMMHKHTRAVCSYLIPNNP